jgi:hypothetical protein
MQPCSHAAMQPCSHAAMQYHSHSPLSPSFPTSLFFPASLFTPWPPEAKKSLTTVQYLINIDKRSRKKMNVTSKKENERSRQVPGRKGFERTTNPYYPCIPAANTWFYNEKTVRQIKGLLETQKREKIIILKGKIGVGKTGTLKKIADEPQKMLGPGYIPIYIDLDKYKELRVENFIFSIYSEIIDNLNILGRPIDIPKASLKQTIVDNDPDSFANLFAPLFSQGNTFILICDDFDCLLAHIDREKLHAFFKYFQIIENKWHNFRLIAALDDDITRFKLTQGERSFLEKSPVLTVEEFAEDDRLRDLITKPVKDVVLYDRKAVQEIISRCGNSIYFQQLICFYIFNNIRDVQIHCALEDVNQAVEQISDDRRPDLDYAWDQRLPLEVKVILSALADETITVPIGLHYQLGENSILDDIFGDQVHWELKKAYDSGYINNSVENRRFSGFPIKIPLWGKWIQKEHPFIKTLMENIDQLADKIDLEKIIKEIKETPKYRLLPFDKDRIVNITEEWFTLKNAITRKKISTGEMESTLHFMNAFSHFVGVKVRDDCEEILGCIRLDIRSLNIGTLDDVYCFIQNRPVLGAEDIEMIEYIATSYSQQDLSKLTIYFCIEKNELLVELMKKPYLNVIAVEENELKRIMLSDQPFQVFRRVILSKLSLQKISPYQITGPTKATFYGRSQLINLVNGARNRSFAIIGARKIGKSSLLYRLAEHPPPNTFYIFMDMQIEIENYQAFLNTLELEIWRSMKENVSFEGQVSTMPRVLRELSRGGKRIIFIFDEIDYFFDFDWQHNFKVLKIFRSMAQNDYCQFIFAGFKTLSPYKRSLDSPLYNFCELIHMAPLDRDDALDLITEPMKSIGIEYHDKADREVILEYTARHPNLLQFYGKYLIEKIGKHRRVEDKRTIFREDIEDLFNYEYEDYIIDEIYMFHSDLDDVDKLMIIIMSEELGNSGNKTISTGQITKMLKDIRVKISLNAVYQRLKTLVMRFILKDHGKNNFSFALPAFPQMIKKRIDEDFRESLIREVIENDRESV